MYGFADHSVLPVGSVPKTQEKLFQEIQLEHWGKLKTSVSTSDKNGKGRSEQMVHYTPSFLQSLYVYI